MDTVQIGVISQRWASLADTTGGTLDPSKITTAIVAAGAAPTAEQWLTPTGVDISVPGVVRVAATLAGSDPGVFSLWVRIVDSPETQILRVEDVLVVDQAAALATPEDVVPLLGPYGRTLPAWVDPPAHLRTAHARVRALLAGTYGSPLGALSGEGVELVRYAEAGLAAASILASLVTQQPGATGLADQVRQLRADALSLLSGRVAGLVVEGDPTSGDDDPTTQDGDVGWTPGGSLLHDPYAGRQVPAGARWSSGQLDSVWFPTPESVRGI